MKLTKKDRIINGIVWSAIFLWFICGTVGIFYFVIQTFKTIFN